MPQAKGTLMKTQRSRPDVNAAILVAVGLLAGCGGDDPDVLLASTEQRYLARTNHASSMIDHRAGSAAAKRREMVQHASDTRFFRCLGTTTYPCSGLTAREAVTLTPAWYRIDQDPTKVAPVDALKKSRAGQAAARSVKNAELVPHGHRVRPRFVLANMITGDPDRAFSQSQPSVPVDVGTRGDLALIATNLQRGEFDKALVAIDVLEKNQPEKPLTHTLRGMALLGKRDAAGARKSFERALALDATYFPAIANLASMDLVDKKPEEARKRFEAVLNKDPRSFQALLALAELRARNKGSPDEVTALIVKAIEGNPKESAPRLALIGHYMRNGDPKRAVTAAQDALAALPEHPELLDALGSAQQAAGETRQAIATYKKLALLQPESPRPYVRMAEVQIAAKDYDDAHQSLRKALTLKPDLIEAQRSIVSLDVTMDRVPDAIAMAREIQKQRPKESVGFILEGNVHASKKDWGKAISAYRQGLTQVDASELAIKLHATLRSGGQAAEADKLATSWVQEHPKDDTFRLYLAELALGRKDYASAMQQYRTVLEMQPDSALVLNNLAWAASQAKDPKALEYAEKANALAPDQPWIMDTLGVLLVEKGDTTRGIQLLQRASSLSPQATSFRLNLAKALIKAGRKDEARKELNELAKLGDKDPARAEVGQLMKAL